MVTLLPRFQYRLRTMFVLVVAVAVPCSWLAWKMEAKRRERAAVAAIEMEGGTVWYLWETESKKQAPGPAWLRNLFGDDFFTTVRRVYLDDKSKATDAAMTYVRDFAYLGTLHLDGTQLTDDGLSNIQGMASLRVVNLDHTLITNSGLKHLGTLTRLEGLWLRGTQVTDVGLEHLERLMTLKTLVLEGTQVTDDGLKHLFGLTALKKLSLEGTHVTDAGVSDLQKALPNCKINR